MASPCVAFQMTVFRAVLDNISDLLLGNIEHQTHILLAWQYISCYGDFLPPLEEQCGTLLRPPSRCLFPLLSELPLATLTSTKPKQ